MAHTPVSAVEVRAFGHRVGAIARDEASGTLVFEYAPEWVQRGIELAPLKMPLRAGPLFSFPDLNRDTFHGLPPLLADSLPDAFGNALIDRWMATRGIDPATITALDRLTYMASRGIGALEFRPPVRDDDTEPTAIQLADLVTAARAQVRGDVSDDDVALQALVDLIRVGTSAGGARAKAVIAYHPGTGQIRSGQFDAPEGFTHWLLKLDGIDDTTREVSDGAGYGRVEYGYHLMARDAGLSMTDCRLLTEHDRAHFVTRRFDRTDAGAKLHVLTLCAMSHLDFNLKRAHDYAQYLQTVDALGLGADAREEAFRRAVFNVAAVNCDDHTKNLSFLMQPDGSWQLAPAYDVTYAYNAEGQWADAHQMTVNGRADDITADHLLELADRFAVPSPRGVIDQVREAVARWLDHADTAGVDDASAHRIASDHQRHGLVA